ncbi:hypothetical protein PanWU01x14_255380 [Parasponia andersonii]|uniref:Uncharacterized protein n=1 Tax=Parasponia andersonii TaxID=3476 RepID=A0A2P5BAW3_PARAD|nr:hypothetical protein PanWU01x14_255380 [Parasponia andersonii]
MFSLQLCHSSSLLHLWSVRASLYGAMMMVCSSNWLLVTLLRQ